MPKTASVNLRIGPADNLITVFNEVRECPVLETDYWWDLNVYLPLRFEFKEDWTPNEVSRQMEFRDKFRTVIERTWSPDFSLLGKESKFVFFQTTIRCFITFQVLDVEATNLEFSIGRGWDLDYLAQRNQTITVIEVYPGKWSSGHTTGNRLRIGEDLSLQEEEGVGS